MDKYESRRIALRSLVDRSGHGAIAAISAKSGIDASYVSRMLYEPGKKGGKRIGEEVWDRLSREYPDLTDDSVADSASTVSAHATASDYVRVQQLDAEADMGEGRVNDDYPEVVKAMDFTPSYIRSIVGFVPPPGRLVLVTGRGDSMIPVIQPGEALMVDTGVTSFDGDGIYLINTGGGQQIKALQHRGDAVYVVSANAALYPAFPLPTAAVIGGKVYLRNRIERFN